MNINDINKLRSGYKSTESLPNIVPTNIEDCIYIASALYSLDSLASNLLNYNIYNSESEYHNWRNNLTIAEKFFLNKLKRINKSLVYSNNSCIKGIKKNISLLNNKLNNSRFNLSFWLKIPTSILLNNTGQYTYKILAISNELGQITKKISISVRKLNITLPHISIVVAGSTPITILIPTDDNEASHYMFISINIINKPNTNYTTFDVYSTKAIKQSEINSEKRNSIYLINQYFYDDSYINFDKYSTTYLELGPTHNTDDIPFEIDELKIFDSAFDANNILYISQNKSFNNSNVLLYYKFDNYYNEIPTHNLPEIIFEDITNKCHIKYNDIIFGAGQNPAYALSGSTVTTDVIFYNDNSFDTKEKFIEWYDENVKIAKEYDLQNKNCVINLIPNSLMENFGTYSNEKNEDLYNLIMIAAMLFNDLIVYSNELKKFNNDILYNDNIELTNFLLNKIFNNTSFNTLINTNYVINNIKIKDKNKIREVLTELFNRIIYLLPYNITTKGSNLNINILKNQFGIIENAFLKNNKNIFYENAMLSKSYQNDYVVRKTFDYDYNLQLATNEIELTDEYRSNTFLLYIAPKTYNKVSYIENNTYYEKQLPETQYASSNISLLRIVAGNDYLEIYVGYKIEGEDNNIIIFTINTEYYVNSVLTIYVKISRIYDIRDFPIITVEYETYRDNNNLKIITNINSNGVKLHSNNFTFENIFAASQRTMQLFIGRYNSGSKNLYFNDQFIELRTYNFAISTIQPAVQQTYVSDIYENHKRSVNCVEAFDFAYFNPSLLAPTNRFIVNKQNYAINDTLDNIGNIITLMTLQIKSCSNNKISTLNKKIKVVEYIKDNIPADINYPIKINDIYNKLESNISIYHKKMINDVNTINYIFCPIQEIKKYNNILYDSINIVNRAIEKLLFLNKKINLINYVYSARQIQKLLKINILDTIHNITFENVFNTFNVPQYIFPRTDNIQLDGHSLFGLNKKLESIYRNPNYNTFEKFSYLYRVNSTKFKDNQNTAKYREALFNEIRTGKNTNLYSNVSYKCRTIKDAIKTTKTVK